MGIMRSWVIRRVFLISAEQNKIIAYNYPQGVLTQTLRAAAAHQPGIISDIGKIGTFVDPRQQGGKLNEVTKEDRSNWSSLITKNISITKRLRQILPSFALPPATVKATPLLKMR